MASCWRFCLGEVNENGEVKGMDRSLYNDCRGWKGVQTSIEEGWVTIFCDPSMD